MLPAALRPLQEGDPGAEMEDPHPGGQRGRLAGKNPLQPQDLKPHRNDRYGGGLEVQLPAEHTDRILECWRDVWYDQLKQQISQSRRSPEPLPHQGGPEPQRGRGERDRERGVALQVRVPLGATFRTSALLTS